MPDNFEQTINLKEKMAASAARSSRPADELAAIYDQGATGRAQARRIERPLPKKDYSRLYRVAVLLIALLIAGYAAGKFLTRNQKPATVSGQSAEWYAVKLVDGEIFYGQIKDVKADPVVMDNVYYNYDQAKGGQKDAPEAGNLRLVKRGQETHGPSGTMDLVRAQVLFMEPMKSDSKVLKAILEYEK